MSSASVSRTTVPVVGACDNACVFCAQGSEATGDSLSYEAISASLGRVRALDDEVTFVGGEPTLHPELPAFVAEAKRLGFRRIGLQTHGRRLARPDVVALLRAAGLTDVHLSIHGATSAAHDYHSGVEGSFVAAIAALSAARSAKLDVVVTTVLTRSNARGLSEVAELLASRAASAWCIAVPRVNGRAEDHFDRVVPRLGIAVPFALHAMSVARSLRLPVVIRGAPSCLLGPFAGYALADEPRAYGAACDGCKARASCSGVEPEYLARFAGDELSPREAFVPAPTVPLARAFVGTGASAPKRSVAVPESPARARVALPVLGKVRPAIAEVGRTTEKKTGPALRELFKELFPREEPAD